MNREVRGFSTIPVVAALILTGIGLQIAGGPEGSPAKGSDGHVALAVELGSRIDAAAFDTSRSNNPQQPDPFEHHERDSAWLQALPTNGHDLNRLLVSKLEVGSATPHGTESRVGPTRSRSTRLAQFSRA